MRREPFLLRPDVVFLNHGSFGACPRPVFDVYQQWQRELEGQPVEFLGRRFAGMMAEARAALGGYVGADPEDLVYVPNATTGINIVARSLPLAAGDEVLSTDQEYGAAERTWRFVCERRGARFIQVALPAPAGTPEQITDALWAQVTSRTRVVFLSHVTSPTALILPVAQLVGRAREAGIVTVIDGAHAAGQLPLDLDALGADFYAANCHKWMCAPKGSGFLWARREKQSLLAPLVVSWGWPEGFIKEQEWQGTRDPAAFLATPAAIEFLRSPAWSGVRERCHALAAEGRAGLLALGGGPALSPDGAGWYAQMVSVPLPLADGEEAQRRLREEFAIEIPVVAWRHVQLMRISVQGYNTKGDIEALLAATARLLEDPRTGPTHGAP
ncbi:MAG TPA: aminotransferase class V-fold PLP-dependent enzyme [bacterium]|nr:aminotransferase class V-fold PLP-dependent enzyme [bacterium]